jgi:DNA-binding CsgD family transcriptional regulator
MARRYFYFGTARTNAWRNSGTSIPRLSSKLGQIIWFSMIDALHIYVVSHCSLVAERAEGAAFLRAAKDLYSLVSVKYLCINLSAPGRSRYFTHCIYSDTSVQQFRSSDAIHYQQKDVPPSSSARRPPDHDSTYATVALNKRRGEAAYFAITSSTSLDGAGVMLRECHILANYFHGHVLRMNGHDTQQELLISAKELDCLKWTAAGKTALEASIILGISERTVRFHLNAAREKLDCVTTTQAVAKAIAHHLIDV